MKIEKVIPFSLSRGSDMISGIAGLARDQGISFGFVHCIGGLQTARLAFYDLQTRSYLPLEIMERVELLSGSGNIAIRDGYPWAHLHAVVSDPQGKTYGGHLLEGSLVFLVEGFIFAMDRSVTRIPDPSTGLTLWNI
ncbi:MAG: PPC domain-containing DNA-binding protein [bacterium JZ-2024 1]